MSVDAGIYATLRLPSDRANYLCVISSLVESGWRPADNGEIVYLPKGDAGRFEWVSAAPGQLADVWHELSSKAAAGELIGISLTWEQSEIGEQFLVDADGSMIFSATINRVRLPGKRITDVSWYVAKIADAMAKSDIYIEQLKWVETGY